MTPRCTLRSVSFVQVIVRLIRWFRQRAPANRILLRLSLASGTSKEAEIKLTNVARASLEELLIDYRDFLRTQGLEEWSKEGSHALRLRDLVRERGATYETFRAGIEHRDPAICANVIIGLIKVTTYLLYKQICRLEADFVKEGGLRERMTRARLSSRAQQQR